MGFGGGGQIKREVEGGRVTETETETETVCVSVLAAAGNGAAAQRARRERQPRRRERAGGGLRGFDPSHALNCTVINTINSIVISTIEGASRMRGKRGTQGDERRHTQGILIRKHTITRLLSSHASPPHVPTGSMLFKAHQLLCLAL